MEWNAVGLGRGVMRRRHGYCFLPVLWTPQTVVDGWVTLLFVCFIVLLFLFLVFRFLVMGFSLLENDKVVKRVVSVGGHWGFGSAGAQRGEEAAPPGTMLAERGIREGGRVMARDDPVTTLA